MALSVSIESGAVGGHLACRSLAIENTEDAVEFHGALHDALTDKGQPVAIRLGKGRQPLVRSSSGAAPLGTEWSTGRNRPPG